MTPRIRSYQAGDAEILADIFYRAVHEGAAGAYDPAARAAWAPARPQGADWTARLAEQITLVADAPDGPCGFMTLTGDGHLDLAFVRPESMGRGVAQALYFALETQARGLGITHLDTDASALARRFFLKQGWSVSAERQVVRSGVTLRTWRMRKDLG